jgi:hypothetical protein
MRFSQFFVRAVVLMGTAATSLAPTSASVASTTKTTSVAVSLQKNCKVVEEDVDGGYSRELCGKSVGGWQAEVVYADPRDELNLIDKSKKTWELRLDSQNCCFASLGETLTYETRGGKVLGLWFPVTFAPDDNGEDKVRTFLFVARADTKACLVGSVAKNQVAAARNLAAKASTLPCLPLA